MPSNTLSGSSTYCLHPVEDVVGVRESGGGQHVDRHRPAAAGAARDEERVVRSEPLLDELDEVGVHRPRERLLLVVPHVRQEGERDVHRHRGMAGEDPLLGRADVETFPGRLPCRRPPWR
jgi:hypothetical protein